MSHTSRSRYDAVIVAIAPAALAAALVAHPYLAGRLPNDAAVAEAVVADTTLWGLAHLGTAVASALVILAFLAIGGILRDAGQHRSSSVGVPFVVIGSTLFAVLAGLEFAPLAAAGTGAEVTQAAAIQAALESWFVPIMVTGALTFAIGVFAFIPGIRAARVASGASSTVIVGALAVMALSRFVPLAVVQLYVQSAAALLALWPLAYHIWRHAVPRPAAQVGGAQEVHA